MHVVRTAINRGATEVHMHAIRPNKTLVKKQLASNLCEITEFQLRGPARTHLYDALKSKVSCQFAARLPGRALWSTVFGQSTPNNSFDGFFDRTCATLQADPATL
jgi:hypothetical protein